MSIRLSTDDQKNLTVFLSGKLGIEEAGVLQEQLSHADPGDASGMVFDFSEVEYVTSSVLRVLLTAKMQAGSKPFRLTGLNENVYKVFEITGFNSILDCEKAED